MATPLKSTEFIWNRVTELTEDIYRLGVNIEDKDYLFEGLWPIPDGTSINAYAIKGEKTALIDATQVLNDFPSSLESQLGEIGFDVSKIDYAIVNHLEPDHAGYLPILAHKNKNIIFCCTPKAAPGLKAFAGIPEERIQQVEDGDTLNLGNNKELVFYHAPNVHWPETMVTYEKNNKILFSCDAFGSYGRVDNVFDDHLSHKQQDFYINEAERYYANIVAKFSRFVLRAIDKLSGLDIKMICPSHGIVWRTNIPKIINTYVRLANYSEGKTEPEVTVVWSSMYGYTKRIVGKILEGLHSEGVTVHLYQVPKDHIGYILGSAWRSTGLVFAMPTYEYRMFPPMAHVIDDLNRKEVRYKKVLRAGAFGWSGGAQKEFNEITENLDWDCLPPVEWQGSPTEDDYKKAYESAKQLAKDVIKLSQERKEN